MNVSLISENNVKRKRNVLIINNVEQEGFDC